MACLGVRVRVRARMRARRQHYPSSKFIRAHKHARAPYSHTRPPSSNSLFRLCERYQAHAPRPATLCPVQTSPTTPILQSYLCLQAPSEVCSLSQGAAWQQRRRERRVLGVTPERAALAASSLLEERALGLPRKAVRAISILARDYGSGWHVLSLKKVPGLGVACLGLAWAES